jgi:hypothetical protein
VPEAKNIGEVIVAIAQDSQLSESLEMETK